jgi:hypothetical protein
MGVPPPAAPPGDAPVGSPLPGPERLSTTPVVWVDSRLGRLTDRIRWAAAPLGFLLFLAAITVHGLVDGPGADEDVVPAGAPAPSASAPATTATTEASSTMPATVAEAPTTAPAAPAAPPEPAAATEPPAEPPPPAAAADGDTVQTAPAATHTTRAAPRFGPVCGLVPGQTVHVSINGRPGPTVRADANGCVIVRR